MTGYKSRGDPVTVQGNPPCPCDRIVTPVLAVTIASMRVTTPCTSVSLDAIFLLLTCRTREVSFVH